MSWQHYLYSKLGKKSLTVNTLDSNGKNQLEETVERIVAMSKVLYGLHMVSFSNIWSVSFIIFCQIDHPQQQQKGIYRSIVSTQRKRAVLSCFRQASLHSLPRFVVFFVAVVLSLILINHTNNLCLVLR